MVRQMKTHVIRDSDLLQENKVSMAAHDKKSTTKSMTFPFGRRPADPLTVMDDRAGIFKYPIQTLYST